MKQYRTVNNLMGWITFIIAATVYCMTIEPTASFWDCPEFITTGYKLEVGHPPGAPFFMLVANLFSQFASDAGTVAKMVNYMSALMSGACILFLFWSITHLVRKLVITDENQITNKQLVTVMGSGLVGALAYTFSDTFWFSAVEGEVYAFSSLFTAVVFWLILKWEDVADEPHSDRWLILIAYLTGLSIGVHLLNLLCLPAIVLVYYYKKVPNADVKGSLMALMASGVLVAVVLYGMVPGIVKVGGWFELLFVNTLGMPFNSGVMVYIVVLAAAIIWGVYESYVERNKLFMAVSFVVTIALLGIPFYGHGASAVVIGVLVIAFLFFYLSPNIQTKLKERYRVSARTLNTALLCTMMIVIGYSSYAIIVIRSTANTPMDQNSPEDIFTLGEYLGREQYGTRPLFYGQAFSSKVALDVKDGYCSPRISYNGTKFIRKEKATPDEKDSYIEIPGRIEYEYAQNMLFPRMYSSQHANEYHAWVDIKGYDVPYDQCGQMIMVNMPTQWENIKFFFSYQLNWMYWRYFLWNFVGRQSDIQPTRTTITDGNWLSGIKWIDRLYTGPQDDLPREVAENKGRNTYYFLPFLLGLVGLLYQLNRDQRNFSIVMILFLMTGIALVFYFNTSPGEPRERDYVYAGSFYAFSIWIGLGVLALRDLIARLTKRDTTAAAAVATLVAMGVPAILAAQNWDDHDRSRRYMARDIGWNYLQSTLPNSIILNYGDNDTFPLWNNQEVYGVRPDVRIMNTSYLGGEWYIDEMKTRANDAAGVPFSLPKSKYTYVNDWVPVDNRIDRPVELKEVIDFIRSDDPRTRLRLDNGTPEGELVDYIPTKRLALPVNKENAVAAGIVREEDRDKMVDTIYLNLRRNAVDKSQLMILDMLANFDWKRPIYLTQVYLLQDLGLMDYLQFDGYAYRLVPIFTPVQNPYEIGRIDPDYAAPLLRDTFRYGNLSDPRVYVDYFLQYNLSAARARDAFARVAKELLRQNRAEEAVELLDLGLERLPTSQIRFTDSNTYPFLEAYYAAGAMGIEGAAAKGDALLREYSRTLIEYIEYYLRFEGVQGDMVSSELDDKLEQLGDLYYLANYAGRKEIIAELNDYYRTLGVSEENLMDAGDKPHPTDTTLLLHE